VCGFIRGTHDIAESAVRGWIPDSSGNRFEWTPIHGRFEKHALIKTFFSEIACNLKTHIHYIEPAPRKHMERPHGPRLAGDSSSSSSSTSMIEQSLQSAAPILSSLPIGSSATLMSSATLLSPSREPRTGGNENEESSSITSSSIQGRLSDTSLGSATSAHEYLLQQER
jgi:hypothetical protein